MQINFLSLGLVAIALIASSSVSAMPAFNRNDVHAVEPVILSSEKATGIILRRNPGLFQRADEEADEEEDDEEEDDELNAQTEENSEENETELKSRGLGVKGINSPTINQQQSITTDKDTRGGSFFSGGLSFGSNGGNNDSNGFLV